jgi:hypothetical protein
MSSNTDGDEFLTRPSIQLVTVEANVILEPKTSTDSAMTERMPPGLATRQMMTSKWTKRMAGSPHAGMLSKCSDCFRFRQNSVIRQGHVGCMPRITPCSVEDRNFKWSGRPCRVSHYGVLCKPPGTGPARVGFKRNISSGESASRSAATVRKRYLMTLTT